MELNVFTGVGCLFGTENFNFSFAFAQEPNLLRWCEKIEVNRITLIVRLDPVTATLFLISSLSLSNINSSKA